MTTYFEVYKSHRSAGRCGCFVCVEVRNALDTAKTPAQKLIVLYNMFARCLGQTAKKAEGLTLPLIEKKLKEVSC